MITSLSDSYFYGVFDFFTGIFMKSWQQVLLGLILGGITGTLLGPNAKNLSYLGMAFLNLIKMVTIPMIFFTIIYGMTSIESGSGLGRISLKAVFTFFCTSMLAVCIGLFTAKLLSPGLGISQTVLNQFKNSQNLPSIDSSSGLEVLVGLIPTNIVTAMANGDILQVIIFALFIGTIMNLKRDECSDIIKTCQQIAMLFFKVIQTIMYIAPVGVFGYIASIVGVEGVGILFSLGKLVVAIGAACLVQYFLFGVLILVFSRVSPLPFYRKIIGAQLIAFATSSSKATLVPLMDTVENKMGVSKKSSHFLLPLSAALNMDGGAIYQSVCAIFFAQMMGIDFSVMQYVTLFLMCTLASIGGAGIPGGVLLFLGMVLNSVGLPIEGVLLVATIDRLLDMMTTVINITGCACSTLLIDRSEKTLDIQKYKS